MVLFSKSKVYAHNPKKGRPIGHKLADHHKMMPKKGW